MKNVAIFAVLAALALGGGCQSAALRSAKIYIQEGESDKALGELEKAVAENPQDVEAYMLMGATHGTRGNFAEMNAAFEKVMALAPEREAEVVQWRRQFWELCWPLVLQERIDEVIHIGAVTYHLLNFTRDIREGRWEAAFYASSNKNTPVPGAGRIECPVGIGDR